MNRSVVLGLGLLAAFATLSPALADEPPPPTKRAPARVVAAPRAEPVRQAEAPSNWTGGQVGGSNGGSFANNAFADPGSYICPPGLPFGSGCYETPFSFTGHSTSYTIGPFLGYRMQLGSFVVGIEGDASYKNTSNSLAQNSTTSISSFVRTDSFYGSIKQGWDSSVRARAGILVTPWALLYGTGGIAFERVSGSLIYNGNLYSCAGCTLLGTATDAGSFNEFRVGATGGGGVEIQLGGPWSARIEYRYTDFGSFTKSVPVTNLCASCASPSPIATVDLHPSFQTVRVGVGFGF
jgi:outer membrane immunogenic protein